MLRAVRVWALSVLGAWERVWPACVWEWCEVCRTRCEGRNVLSTVHSRPTSVMPRFAIQGSLLSITVATVSVIQETHATLPPDLSTS